MKTLSVIIAILFTSPVFAQQKEIKIGDDASHFRLKIVTPNRLIEEKSIEELKGNVIIMQWMTSGCRGSKVQLKEMDSYYKKYGNDISFFAITDDPVSLIAGFKAKNNYRFPFCKDKGKMENEFFYFTAGSHMAIINRKGICLYRGSPSLSFGVLDTLIAKDRLPLEFQKAANESFNIKEYSYKFQEYSLSLDRYAQIGFKLEPYNSSLISTSRSYTGKYFYGYNLPVYSIYRDGLLLIDNWISISDSLKEKLNSQDTTNLYMVGFNINKRSSRNKRYRKIFKSYLDSALGLTTKLTTQKEDVIMLTKINEGENITKTKGYNTKSTVKGDTLTLNNITIKNFSSALHDYFPLQVFVSKSLKTTTYDIRLVLKKNLIDKEKIIEELKQQGIDAQIEQANVPHLEFLPAEDSKPVTYLHTKQKQTAFKIGYNIGYGKGYHDFSNGNYQGEKLFSFKGGFFTHIKLNNFLAIRPEINYQTNGSKGNYTRTRLHSINTPLNILLSTNQQHPIGVYIKSGGYYSYNFASKIEGEDLDFNSIRKNIFGWSYGFGLRAGSRTTIDFSYNRGLTGVIKNRIIGDVNEKSRYLTLGFCF